MHNLRIVRYVVKLYECQSPLDAPNLHVREQLCKLLLRSLPGTPEASKRIVELIGVLLPIAHPGLRVERLPRLLVDQQESHPLPDGYDM